MSVILFYCCVKAKGRKTNQDVKKRIAKNIKYYREESGLTQIELSLVAECSFEYISAIENYRKNPTLDVLVNIAAALHKDISDITKKETPDI